MGLIATESLVAETFVLETLVKEFPKFDVFQISIWYLKLLGIFSQKYPLIFEWKELCLIVKPAKNTEKTILRNKSAGK